MTTPRKHAELAARYMADDSLKCWIRSKNSAEWYFCDLPAWNEDMEYHVGHIPPRPPMNVCGRMMPQPMRTEPDTNTDYWTDSTTRVERAVWHGDITDITRLNQGRCFFTAEDARAWLVLNTELRVGWGE